MLNLNRYFTKLLAAYSVPARCQLCHAWPVQDGLCAACQAHFATSHLTRCNACAALRLDAEADCLDCLGNGKPPLSACYAALSYQWPWRDVIDAFKFNGQPSLAGILAQQMAQHPAIVQALAQCDVVVPVPIHAQRLAERGYHQTWLLAKALRKRLPTMPAHACQLRPYALLRHKHVSKQSSLTKEARSHNLQAVFSVNPAEQAWINQRHIVLIDDVLTTGATLQQTAQCLVDAGAASVQAVVLARAEPPALLATLSGT